MDGSVDPVVTAAFVTALRAKGETAEEVTGLARSMRDHAVGVAVPGDAPLLDTCGTGGDRSGTVNVSTMAAFVCAGAGVRVAKHGNRAASSACGSADVLEALGVRIELLPDRVLACIDEAGIGFFFDQMFSERSHQPSACIASANIQGMPTRSFALSPVGGPRHPRSCALSAHARRAAMNDPPPPLPPLAERDEATSSSRVAQIT